MKEHDTLRNIFTTVDPSTKSDRGIDNKWLWVSYNKEKTEPTKENGLETSLHELRVEKIFNSLMQSDFEDISDAELAEMNTTTRDATMDSSNNNLQTEVGAEELNINNNNAADINLPNDNIIDEDNNIDKEIVDPTAVLKKLLILKSYQLNQKCYCD